MTPEGGLPAGTALAPKELEALLGMDAQTRAEWMLEDCTRRAEAWALENGGTWVLFGLSNPREGGLPWALPLWPRQELAALASKGSQEQVRRISLEKLLDSLLPEVEQRGWQVLAFPVQGEGFCEPAGDFGRRLAETWDEMTEEEG